MQSKPYIKRKLKVSQSKVPFVMIMISVLLMMAVTYDAAAHVRSNNPNIVVIMTDNQDMETLVAMVV